MVLKESELVEAVTRDRAAGRTIGFANGCFDLLHVGHVRYLQGSAAEADRLVVAINDDTSLSRLKGPGRPILPAADRAEMVAAVRGVDYVVVFGDDTVETVPERAVVRSYGGRTAIVGDPKDHSTRELLARLSRG